MLLINNQEVEQLLPMKDCIEVIEEVYREQLPTEWFLQNIRD